MTEGTPVKTTRTFTNRALICVDCKEEFAYPISAQEYFAERGEEDPKRCRACYQVHKAKKAARAKQNPTNGMLPSDNGDQPPYLDCK